MTIGAALDLLIEVDSDFATLIAELYARRHTGSTVVDWFNGQPRAIYFPGVKVRLECRKNLTGEPKSSMLSGSKAV